MKSKAKGQIKPKREAITEAKPESEPVAEVAAPKPFEPFEPVTQKGWFEGYIPGGRYITSIKIPVSILKASGMGGSDKVMIACERPDEIVIRKLEPLSLIEEEKYKRTH